MHFLTFTLASMQRRFLTSLMMIFATVSILSCSFMLGIWSYWVQLDQSNLKAERLASVFVNSTDAIVVTQIADKIQQIPGIESAKQIAVHEFLDYLEKYFPDIADGMQKMSADSFPSMIEIIFPKRNNRVERIGAINKILSIPGVARVDDGAKQVGSAAASFGWLATFGWLVSIGLLLVLVIVAMAHFQAIRYKDDLEFQLLRSFGANSFWLFMPWVLEAIIYGIVATTITGSFFWFSKDLWVKAFNQFFETLGYESFVFNIHFLLITSALMLGSAIFAHICGGIIALLRGKLA